MYMSYCRYEGTMREVNACLGDVDEHLNEEAEYKVSENEIDYFRQMIHRVYDFMYENDLIVDGEIDENRMDEIADKMSQSWEDDEEED